LVSLFQLGYCSNLVYENHAHPPLMKTPSMMRTTTEGLFSRINSGDCNSNGLAMITNKQECEEAAKSLGLVMKEANLRQQKGKPHGCIYASNDYLVFASPVGHSYDPSPCGSRFYAATYDCLCAEKGYREIEGACRNGKKQYEDSFSCVTTSTLEGCQNKCDAVSGCGAVSWNSYLCCGVSMEKNGYPGTTKETGWKCYFKY